MQRTRPITGGPAHLFGRLAHEAPVATMPPSPALSEPGFFNGQLMTEDGLSQDTLAALDALVTETEQPSTAADETPVSKAADETTETETEAEATSEAKPEAETDDKTSDDADKDDAKDEDEEEAKPRRSKNGTTRLKARIAALEAQLAQRTPAPAAGDDALARAVEAEVGAPPKEEDYKGDYLAFERALTAYEADKRIVTREVKRDLAAQQKRATEASLELVADHQDRIEDLAKAVPGIKEKLAAAASRSVADHVSALVLESEKSALIAVHLAENPQTLDALNRMSDVKAARELGRIESKLSRPTPKATKAPAPVAPVKGAAKPAFDPAKASMSDFAPWLTKHVYGDRG